MGDTCRVGEQEQPASRPEADPAPARLDLDVDLVPERGSQDSDASWGDPADRATGERADVRRLLADKPPHHVG